MTAPDDFLAPRASRDESRSRVEEFHEIGISSRIATRFMLVSLLRAIQTPIYHPARLVIWLDVARLRTAATLTFHLPIMIVLVASLRDNL